MINQSFSVPTFILLVFRVIPLEFILSLTLHSKSPWSALHLCSVPRISIHSQSMQGMCSRKGTIGRRAPNSGVSALPWMSLYYSMVMCRALVWVQFHNSLFSRYVSFLFRMRLFQSPPNSYVGCDGQVMKLRFLLLLRHPPRL